MKPSPRTPSGASRAPAEGILSAGLGRAHDGLSARIRAFETSIGGEATPQARLAAFGGLARAIAEHFRFEEESLFPNLLLVTGDQARAAVDLLQKEHVELLRHLEATGAALHARSDARKPFEEFRKLLSTHQAREMSLVYPLSDMLLPPSLRRLIADLLPGSAGAS